MDDSATESFAALTRFIVGEARFDETLERVTELARQAVAPAEMAGITMMVDDRATTAFFTNQEVPEIDQGQYDVGDGPCLASFRSKARVSIDSTADDPRWPTFCQTAAEYGVHSTLSLPLVAGGDALGALNLYALQPSAFSRDDVEGASLFATQAAVVLANTQTYWDAYDYSQRLAAAMETRGVIEQAKGILMARAAVNADQAFAMLRRQSQGENRKLRDIAAEIVQGASNGTGSGE